MLRILYLHWGGNSGVVESVSKQLAQQGHEIIPVNFGVKLSPRQNLFNLRTSAHFLYTVTRFRRDWRYHYNSTVRAFKLISGMAQQEVERVRPDAILQSGARFGVDPGNLPYVVYVDHTRAISERYKELPGVPAPRKFGRDWLELEHSIYERATAIRTFSQYAANSFRDDYGISVEKVVPIGAGPNLEALPDLSERNEPGQTVLAVGVAPVPKGFGTLEKSFPKVRDAHPDAQLVFVGADGRNSEGVTYRGRLPRAQMGGVYAEADIFALPTVREAFGISYVEAMAYGLPCLGSDIEAIPEIIEHGTSGFVVPPTDPDAWSERINWLLDNPDTAREMGKAGRARVESFYNWPAVCQKLERALSGA